MFFTLCFQSSYPLITFTFFSDAVPLDRSYETIDYNTSNTLLPHLQLLSVIHKRVKLNFSSKCCIAKCYLYVTSSCIQDSAAAIVFSQNERHQLTEYRFSYISLTCSYNVSSSLMSTAFSTYISTFPVSSSNKFKAFYYSYIEESLFN
jgi:hypothetical protein